MSFQVNLTPEDIDALVKDSILKAGFGNAVTTAVQKALSGYDNPIDKEVKIYVARVAADIIQDKFADQIKQLVATQIEQQVTQELMERVTSETVVKMCNAVDRW